MDKANVRLPEALLKDQSGTPHTPAVLLHEERGCKEIRFNCGAQRVGNAKFVKYAGAPGRLLLVTLAERGNSIPACSSTSYG